MITFNNKTKLTTQAEKLFVEVGGEDPNKILSKKELTAALSNTIKLLAERRSPILLKLYKQVTANKTS